MGGTRVAARWVLVAAGPWTPELLDPGGHWRPIHASWGVIIEIDSQAGPEGT
jgi:glycine/D-amino acid oxidase-like deaminating enzyme